MSAKQPRPTTLPSMITTSVSRAHCASKRSTYGKKYTSSKIRSLSSQRVKRLTRLSGRAPSGILVAILGSWVLLLPTIPLMSAASVVKCLAMLPVGWPGYHLTGCKFSREHTQGHSVFQFNTNEGQCQVRLGREAAARSRNVGGTCPSQQPNRHIAQRCHHLRNVPTPHLRMVFIEGHIADPMPLVLNLPMAADECEQPLGCAPLGAQTGDPIDHFHPFLGCFWCHDVPSQFEHLRQTGPVAV